MAEWISAEAVVQINREVLARTGGARHSLLSPSGLTSALRSPHQTFDGRPLVPSELLRIAMIYQKLIQNHPFLDGNKRTATAVLHVLLDANGYTGRFADEELVSAACNVALHRLSISDVVSWLSSRVQRQRFVDPDGRV